MEFLSPATLRFIAAHREDDVQRLALSAGKHDDVDLTAALGQIVAWQTARRKLPSWAATDGLLFPPRLAMEQCSSETTARYKARLAERLAGGGTLVDLTGGFGVDFAFMAKAFTKAVYVERQEVLCQVARHNFPLLGIARAQVVCGEAEDFLDNMPHADLIYLDPARRDDHGRRTFAIADCTPDVAALSPRLLQKASHVVVKLSPMLDWHKAAADLGHHVAEIHIVATANECKELLLVMRATHQGEPLLTCVNDDQETALPADGAAQTFENVGYDGQQYLFEPNAALMKAGCFAWLGNTFGLNILDPNSHLFAGNNSCPAFPGRRFRIKSVSTMNKKQLRTALRDISQANVSVRNFPLSAQDLRQRLKLRDGGDTYIFGTTCRKAGHLVFVCQKTS